MKEKEEKGHVFGPCFDSRSAILILGSFPSIKSRAMGFYYGHPQNRFWQVLSSVYGEAVPFDVEGRKAFILAHHLALYDSLEACWIKGSEDASIEKETPAVLNPIFQTASIHKILFNGKAAERYYLLYQKKRDVPLILLPSTSSANAAWDEKSLVRVWGEALLN